MRSIDRRVAVLFSLFTALFLFQPVNVPVAYGGDDSYCCWECCDPCSCAKDSDECCRPILFHRVTSVQLEWVEESPLHEALSALLTPARATFAVYVDNPTKPTQIHVLPVTEGKIIAEKIKVCLDDVDPLWSGCIPPNPNLRVGDPVRYEEIRCNPSTGGTRYKNTGFTGRYRENFRNSEATGGTGPAQ